MNGFEQVTAIAFLGAVLFFVHFLVRIFIFLKFRNTQFLLDCVVVLIAVLHYFYIYIYYSGFIEKVPWLKGLEILNNYVLMVSYYAYIQYAITGKAKISGKYIFLFFLLPVHIFLYLYQGVNSEGGFQQLLKDYSENSVPEGFPTIHYLIFIVVNSFIWITLLTSFLVQNNVRITAKKNNDVTLRKNIFWEIYDLWFNPGSPMIRFLSTTCFLIFFIRAGYGISAYFGGRNWAVYYNSVEIILAVILTAMHGIHPILVKAKILKPVTHLFQSDNDLEKDLEIWKKIISLMENEKPFLDEDFHLESLAGLVGISRNRVSAIINRYSEASFSEFLHEYRICEVQKILKNQPNVKPSLAGFEVGYKSVSVFYNIFHKKTGMSPQKYRESAFKSFLESTDLHHK